MQPQEIKNIYNLLAERAFTRNSNLSAENSIANRYLLPVNLPEGAHPLAYIFKNAIMEIYRLSSFNMKLDFMTQLNSILYTIQYGQTYGDAKILLLKSPMPGDPDWNENRVFNIINRKNYNTEEEYLSWLDFDEICIVAVRGVPYFITRKFLSSVFDLKPNQTYENYFTSIGLPFVKVKTYETGVAFFELLKNTMPEIIFDFEGGAVNNMVNRLKMGQVFPLETNKNIDAVLFYTPRTGFCLSVQYLAYTNVTSKLGYTGLLDNLLVNSARTELINLDTVSLNNLLSYYSQPEERFRQEALDMLYHILAYYPRYEER